MPELNNIEIFPINMVKDSLKKSDQFFKDLNIKNLNIYFDNPKTLAKEFSLRGVQQQFYLIKKEKNLQELLVQLIFWIKNLLNGLKIIINF